MENNNKIIDEDWQILFLARDMTWRDMDIIKTFAFRWLVEVFIQDWKQYEGWSQLSKQPGEEGSFRGVTLSLLSDPLCYFIKIRKCCLKINNLLQQWVHYGKKS